MPLISLFVIIYTIFSTSFSLAAPLDEAIAKDYPSLEALYKTLHRNPELSFHEIATARRMAAELRAAGYTVTEHVGGTGVVGVLKNGDGPVLLIRTDMDALPVKEQTGFAYASTVTTKDDSGAVVPVMHACGHDIHMTVFTGTARRLAEMKSQWHGTLVMIGQPAEERIGGAAAMLKDGLFTRFPKPTNLIGLHDTSDLPAGMLGYTVGYTTAAADSIDITVHGIGSHGSRPQDGKDPVLLAAQIITGLQTVVSRSIDPQDPGVITVGAIHGGTKRNIIGTSVTLELTVRSYTDKTRKALLDGIKRIADGTAMAAGLPPELYPTISVADSFAPATFNTTKQTEAVAALFKQHFGDTRVQATRAIMGSEDYSEYWLADKSAESTFFWLGAAEKNAYAAAKAKGVNLPTTHSPFFAPDPEPTIKTGVEAMTVAALGILKR